MANIITQLQYSIPDDLPTKGQQVACMPSSGGVLMQDFVQVDGSGKLFICRGRGSRVCSFWYAVRRLTDAERRRHDPA